MLVNVIGDVVNPALTDLFAEEDATARAAMQAEGTLRAAFGRADGNGMILLVEAPDMLGAMISVSRLPSVANGLTQVRLSEVHQL